jgi:hypothetical protein
MASFYNKIIKEATKVTVVCLLLVDCGTEADFAAQQPSQGAATEAPSQPEVDPFVDQIDELDAKAVEGKKLDIYLDLSCPASGPSVGDTLGEELLSSGLGHTEIDLRDYEEVTLSAGGKLCQFDTAKRDVAIIVDVSGSMSSDPLINGTCHRNEAIKKIMENLWSSKTHRVALLTFNSRAVGKSYDPVSGEGGFFSEASELESQLGRSLAEVLCHARSGTNYVAPFVWADELFSRKARSGVELEIYFVSDGEPELVDFGDGVLVDYYDSPQAVKIAENMKSVGYEVGGQVRTVRISTLMIGGENQILPIISSKMRGGNPYYLNLADFSQLETRLLNMVTPTLLGLELSYRTNTMQQWAELDRVLDPDLNDFQTNGIPVLRQDGDLRSVSVKLRQTYAYGPDRRLFASVGEESTMDRENQAANWHKVPGSLAIEEILQETGEYFDFTPENAYKSAIHHEVDFRLEAPASAESSRVVLDSIEAGEWVQYPIEVESSGLYNLILEIDNRNLAHKSALHFSINGQILVGADGQSSIIVSPNSRSSLAEYTALRLSDVSLSAGKHLLQVHFDTGGYVVRTLSITK